jgi:hypothetical protein
VSKGCERNPISKMKREVVRLRFDLNIAERTRQGKPTAEPTQTLEVDLAKLEPTDRQLLERRLERGRDNVFDVCKIQWDGTKEFRRPTRQEGLADFYAVQFPVRIQAIEPTVEALLAAVREDFNRFKVR